MGSKKDKFLWFTPQCRLKFDNSQFPCECEPWHENWYNPLLPEADCSKCEVAKSYGMIPEEEVKDDE